MEKHINLTEHSAYGHIEIGAVTQAKYAGKEFYVKTNDGERCLIRPNDDVVIAFGNKTICLFGRLGNFKDEKGNHHAGAIFLDPKDVMVKENLTLYGETEVHANPSFIGRNNEEQEKIYKDIAQYAPIIEVPQYDKPA